MAEKEYTPTTDEVREAFRAAMLHPDDLDLDDAPGQAFDRWLAAHDREVAERAWDEATDTLSPHREDVAPAAVADLERRNPYRGPSACGCDLTGMAPPASPRPTVWRFPYRVPAARCFEGPWFVGTSDAEIIYSTHPTHAEAIADAWARTHPKEAPDGR